MTSIDIKNLKYRDLIRLPHEESVKLLNEHPELYLLKCEHENTEDDGIYIICNDCCRVIKEYTAFESWDRVMKHYDSNNIEHRIFMYLYQKLLFYSWY